MRESRHQWKVISEGAKGYIATCRERTGMEPTAGRWEGQSLPRDGVTNLEARNPRKSNTYSSFQSPFRADSRTPQTPKSADVSQKMIL